MYTHYKDFVHIEHPGLIKKGAPQPQITENWAFIDCPKCLELYQRELNKLRDQHNRK